MKKVKVIEKFNYRGTPRVPGQTIEVSDLSAISLVDHGMVEYSVTPINRIYK